MFEFLSSAGRVVEVQTQTMQVHAQAFLYAVERMGDNAACRITVDGELEAVVERSGEIREP